MRTIHFVFLLSFLASGLSCKILSKKEYTAVRKTQDSLFSALGEAKVKNIGLTNKVKELTSEMGEVSSENKAYQNRLDSLKEAAEQAELKLKNLNETYSTYREKLKTQRENLSSERDSLYGDLKEKQKRIEEFEKKINERKQKTQRLKEKFNSIAKTFKTLEGFSVSTKGEKIYISIADRLLFEKGEWEIDLEGKKILTALAKELNKHEEVMITVEGHTDSDKILKIDCIEDNWDLSVIRATSVVRHLINVAKINPERIIASGRAEFSPLLPEVSEQAKAKNRRIEIILIPPVTELYEILNLK